MTRGRIATVPKMTVGLPQDRPTSRGQLSGPHGDVRLAHDPPPPSSEQQAHDIVERAGDLVYAHDLTGRLTFVNRAVLEATGYSREEALSLDIAQLIAPDALGVATDLVERRLRGETDGPHEITLVSKDGQRLDLEVSLQPVIAQGVPVGVQGIARDVRARKRTEAVLRRSEERLRQLIEHSSDALAIVASDSVVFYASHAIERLLGCPSDQVIGQRLLDLVHPDERDRADWIFAELRDRIGASTTTELRLRHTDGSYRFVEAVCANRLEEPGLSGFVINLRDVTERRAAAHALAESEVLYRSVFDAMVLGLARVDLSGRVLEANRALSELTGQSADRLRGLSFTDLAAPGDKDIVGSDLQDVLGGKREQFRGERRLLSAMGGEFWATLTFALVRYPGGSRKCVIVTVENINARKHTEEDLRSGKQALETTVQHLEQQTRDISLLSEMGDHLQACRNAEEAHTVIGDMVAQLFPGEAGAVCIIGTSGSVVEAVATWGDDSGERIFGLDDCWALRRGRTHLTREGRQGLVCRHVHRPASGAHLCVPMMAHGELLGLMTLTLAKTSRPLESVQRLAMTVVEHVALALANLKLHETLRSQSIRDPLTGLFNRRYMEESLEREMRRAIRGRQPVGIIMIDIDHFKQFNDKHGHDAGDEVLRSVGAILQRSVRAEDIACRYGGEEFTLILPDASLVDASHRAEYLRQTIKALSVQHRKLQLPTITVSAGVAIYPDHGPTASAVLRAADAALYRAKQNGRDRVAVNHSSGLFSDSIVDFTG